MPYPLHPLLPLSSPLLPLTPLTQMQVRSHFLIEGDGAIFSQLAAVGQLLRVEDPGLYHRLEQV